jgi:hypothetical protein
MLSRLVQAGDDEDAALGYGLQSCLVRVRGVVDDVDARGYDVVDAPSPRERAC